MRTLTPEAQAVLEGPAVALAVLAYMGFSPAVRLASGAVAIQTGGNLYYGAGSLGAIEPVRDEAGATNGLRFALSGVPSETLALALAEETRGKACTVSLAVMDPATHAVVDQPVVWAGNLDQMPITYSGSGCTIAASATHKGALLRRPKPFRYTDGDQQRVSSGDTSLRFVVSQSQKADIWPAHTFYERR